MENNRKYRDIFTESRKNKWNYVIRLKRWKKDI